MFSFIRKDDWITKGLFLVIFFLVVFTPFSPLLLKQANAQALPALTVDQFKTALQEGRILRIENTTAKGGSAFNVTYQASDGSVGIFSVPQTDPDTRAGILAAVDEYCTDSGTGVGSPTCNNLRVTSGPAGGTTTTTGSGSVVDPVELGLIEYFTTGYFLVAITSLIFGLAGSLFDASLDHFVFGMGDLVTNRIGDTIEESWGIIRDLVNLTFVFGLIYIGFLTILKGEGAGTKKMLTAIVIGALLVNFSLYFAKVIIDLGNITAYEISNQIGNDSRLGIGDSGSISGFFADRMGIGETMISGATLRERITKDTTGGAFTLSIMVSITLLVASFIFFAGALLMLTRFVALVFLLIFSPIAFAAAFLPKVGGWSKEWWDKIIAQTIFAPAFLFLIFIAAKVASIDVLGLSPGDPVSFTTKSASVFLVYILIIGFLVGALILAKQIGAIGATTALDWGKAARKFALRQVGATFGATTFGATAAAGRSTIGRWGYGLKNSDKVQTLATQKGLKGFVGRRLLNTAEKTSQASFDARRVVGLGKKLEIGEGKKGGYEQRIKDIEKKEKAFAEKLGEDEKVYAQMGVGDKYTAVKAKRASIEEGYRKLSETTDATARNLILANISTLSDEISNIEKDKTFATAKAQAATTRKREYASNLENRGKQLPLVARKLYRVFVRSAAENEAGAKAIRKDLDKSAEKKLLAALKKELKEGGEGAGGGKPPPAADGGEH